jgi:hypothetical protein
MRYLEEKTSNISTLIENQFPQFVQQNNQTFLKFLESYYESLENKYQPLDLAANLIDYYNIGYYRPNQLVRSTVLVGNLLSASSDIDVQSTVGFPKENGYIKINNEIIFYRSLTDTKFVDCVRGTTALVLENIPQSEIILKRSIADEHANGSIVENISYSYAIEFFNRIKSEIAPLITENVVDSLDFSQFLKNIKSFYSAKGSLNGHRIIFKILFNDKKFNFILKPRGSGAKVKINNYNQYIPKEPKPQIVSGGTDYDPRKDPTTNELINPPVIDILGSGIGEVNEDGLRPNKTAIVKVTDINSSGEIVDLEVIDSGEFYIGPITGRVRPKIFDQDQKVYNASGTGYGRVDFWDRFRNELVLYDVVGFFKPDDEIIGIGGEEPRAFVSRAFIGTSSIRDGIEILPEEQNIEFPRQYVFRTSDSVYSEKKVIRCKFLRGDIDTFENLTSTVNLIQDADKLFGVNGVNIESDNLIPLRDNTIEFEISSNSDLNDIYLPPTSVVVKVDTSSGDKFAITVDDASRFPVTNGIISIDGILIEYETRTFNQFFGCRCYLLENNITVNLGAKVISWGRKKYNVVWQSEENIKIGEFRYFGDNLYKSTTEGISGSIEPTHTFGVERDGLFELGDANPVSWEYIGSNTFKHSLYIKSTNELIQDVDFELIAMPGEVIIQEGGSLHTKQQYEFADFISPNTQMFNFTTSEISNRLALLLSSNFNRNNNTVTNDKLPSWKSLTGFSTVHDYEDYIYVPTTAIPPWWSEITDLSEITSGDDEFKKVSFTNQKLVSRWKKTSLLYDTKVISDFVPTKKAIGLNVDAIQVNSYKGNTINYGKIESFVIGDGGNYKVPITSSGQFNFVQFPSFALRTDNDEIIEVSNENNLIRISAGIHNIDFNALAEKWSTSGELTNFTTKPVIEVINNNPRKTSTVNKSNINLTDNTFTVSFQQSVVDAGGVFKTAEAVTYSGAFNNFQSLEGALPSLIANTQYYLRKVSEFTSGGQVNVIYSLHKTETDSVLNTNKLSLNYIETLGDFNFTLITDPLNPPDFEQADLDLSYNESTGIIDNIIIRNSGTGYVESPTIKIVGGGKVTTPETIIPYKIDGIEIIEMRGKITSYTNFYNEDNYKIDSFIEVPQIFENAPKVSVDNGSEAEASVYVANGSIVSVVLIRKGKNYYTKPTVKIIGNGKDAVIEAKIENGEIVGFDIINAGTGYTQSPIIQIIPNGSGAVITSRLKEWTFNLIHRMSILDRIDDFGGYVYDTSDSIPQSDNPRNFVHILPDNELPPSIDNKQYLLLKTTDKILAKYTISQRKGFLDVLYPGEVFGYQTNQQINNILSKNVHSPALVATYDGAPLYGKKGHSIRYDNRSPLVELKSQYKLKYSDIETPGSLPIIVNNVTYYMNREDGPSIHEYPLGSFIEDYEFVPGDDNALDVHNGRFCVTPEFPEGRYCYFATTSSFDPITNSIIELSGINFEGFPYFIGDTYSSEPDTYPNKGCRTNDKIPKFFTRAFEKEIPSFEVPGFKFDGLASNENYPRENLSYDKTIVRSASLTPGTVDSIIIESAGTNYKIGDRLKVNNTLTYGSGLSGFVSKVFGKQITSFTYLSRDNKVTVKTAQSHGLSVGDYVYLDYNTNTTPVNINFYDGPFFPISSKIKDSVDLSLLFGPSTVEKFDNKKFYTLSLNSKFKYKFNIPNLSYKFTLDVDKTNEIFVTNENTDVNSTILIIDAQKLPNIVYLHIGNYIYEINTSKEYADEYRVTSINLDANEFTFNVNFDSTEFETSNLVYFAKSKGASGGIAEIIIANKGYDYRKLPEVEVESTTGTGAIVQTNSNTIGKIRNITYLSPGGGFTSNLNVNHYLNLPATAKIINNFEIYEVEVISGGSEYKDTLKILVNGQENLAEFKINAQVGVITSVDVLDGGSNFSAEPTLQVVSTTGIGAVLKAKIRRKQIFTGEPLRSTINSNLFPVEVSGKVVNFDQQSSTLEYDELVGQFAENDFVYTSDGRKYGKIISINRPKAYAKVNPYITLENYRTDIAGNTSEFLQKITDNNFYQDWSYVISSSRDTIEWKDQVEVNTHPAGHNLFGKKIIERRKFFYTNPEDIFKSSVIFTTNLVNLIKLKLKLSPCNQQTISLVDVSDFSVGDYIFGTLSEAVGEIIEITGYSLKINNRNDKSFVVGEVVVKVSPEFAFGVNSVTDKFLGFYEGVFQEPDVSYEVSPFNIEYDILSEVFIPKFNLLDGEKLLVYKLENSFEYLDPLILNSSDNSFILKLNNQSYEVNESNINEFIFSVGGSVQNPASFTTSNNTVFFNELIKYDNTRLFAIRQENLKVLEFDGPESGSEFTINYTPDSSCNLLIFYTGVSQNHLLTAWDLNDDTITFSESVDKSKIFGWYIDEEVTCELLDADDINKYKVVGTRGCTTKNFTQFIHSSAIKTPTSLYEIRKEVLDGTVVADSDGTTVYGFDTKFTYTSPKYSKSYVEIMDPLPFNGSQKSFTLKTFDNLSYVPVNGKKSLVVYVNNQVLDTDDYSVSGSTITFSQIYTSSVKCTIIDFISSYSSNYTDENSEILDRLNVSQNGTRKRFNLSDRGVPQYARNPGDIFVLKNGVLKRPELRSRKNKIDSETESIVNNKFTFVTAPTQSDNINLVYFNRQLLPEPTKNVVLDDFRCFNGTRTDFPLTVDGILLTPIDTKHVFVIRNGVYQKPEIDYIVTGSIIDFSTAPDPGEEFLVYYSYDSLNQNILFDSFKMFDGIETTFPLTTNYISTSVLSSSHIQVYRNGVYQHPLVDYTINGTVGGKYITFVTPPTQNDDIFITNYMNNDFVDVTSRFTQFNATTLQYNSQSPTIDTNLFVIYINGLLQVGSAWSFDSVTNRITFGSNVSLSTDKISIYAFKTQRRIIDSFNIVDGIDTYSLDVSGSAISADLPSSDSDILVSIDGIVQEPGNSYTVTDSTITLLNLNQNIGSTVYVYQTGNSTHPVELIDYLNDDYSKNTYKLTTNFSSFNPPNSDDILVLRNGVVQNPTEDYISGNGFITFTTNVNEFDDLFMMYTHGTEELSISTYTDTTITLSSIPAENDYKNIILFVNGAPKFWNKDFSIEDGVVTLFSDCTIDEDTTPFVIKYPSVIFIDDINDCPNGERTRFKLLYNYENLVISDIVSDADILISVNGVVQYPGVQYTLTPNRGFVDFLVAPQFTDEIFMVRMSGNQVVDLTPSGQPRTYNLSTQILDQDNLVIFSNDNWKFNELGQFSYVNDSRVQLSVTNTSQYVFGIKFIGTFKLLDQINTPYNSSNTKFNMFVEEENFVPVGTISNNNIADETGLFVVKNGKVLDPKVDYQLSGDIRSQIVFAVAPTSSDKISVRSVGSFDKLNTITTGFTGSQKIYNITDSVSNAYYPNATISRPRELENQVLVIRDGNIQSPIYDYYIDNNKLVFNTNVPSSTSKIVLIDFRGVPEDVAVSNRFNQIKPGDQITLYGENTPRKVTEVLSPTVLKTEPYDGLGPQGMTANALYSNGKVTDIVVTNGGIRYEHPVVLRTKGSGTGSKFTAGVNYYQGGVIQSNTVEVQYPGYNVYTPQSVVATGYAFTYKQQQLNKSQIRKATKLSANINDIVEFIPLANTSGLPSNTPSVTVSSLTGSGAEFKVYVSDGKIRKVEIISIGIGYDDTSIEIELVGGGGSGCVLEPVLDAFGRFQDVIIRNPGSGYDTFKVIIYDPSSETVNSEIIEYTYVTSTGVDGCTRGVVGNSSSHLQNTLVYFDNYL